MADVFDTAKTDWTSEDYYNYDDLNRVESMTSTLSDKYKTFHAVDLLLAINISRSASSIEFADGLNRIERNILSIASALNKEADLITPKTSWFYNNPFSFEDANRLEKNLVLLNNYVSRNLEYRQYAGMYTVTDQGVI